MVNNLKINSLPIIITLDILFFLSNVYLFYPPVLLRMYTKNENLLANKNQFEKGLFNLT